MNVQVPPGVSGACEIYSICACVAGYVEYVVSFPVHMRVVNESSVRSAVIFYFLGLVR